jgi:hypothetical protein
MARSRAGLIALALLGLAACRPKELALERLAGISIAMPLGRTRAALAEPSDGFVEHVEPGMWRVRLSWDPDPRAGSPTDEEALEAAELSHATIVQSAARLRDLTEQAAPARDGEAQAWAVDGHPAALVRGAEGEALIWRCEKSGRIFRLLREGALERDFPLAVEIAGVQCHDAHTRAANAQVPSVNVASLGDGWSPARRTSASAVYLRSDALEVVFAGRKAALSEDLVVAAHLAPAWIEAAGLREVHVALGEHANGPQGHPAIVLRGEAVLDGRPVRWSLLTWRCLQRARTFEALVIGEPPAAGAPASASWTGHDAALLAVRCHGSGGQ